MRVVICLVALVLAAVIIAPRLLPLEEHNFSQYPGFEEYFAAHPAGEALPTAAEIALLRRFRPRFFLPKSHEGLVSFYDDFISRGILRDGEGRVISDRVTPEILNAHKNDPAAVFSHAEGPARPFTPVVFGRIEDVAVDFGPVREDLRFLTYTTVHRRSGLPNGLPGWQALGLALVGSLSDWHQLDHYTAATVVLDDRDVPIALMLQQHNYRRTYLIGETVTLPADGRVEVDIAERSNELYPHLAGRTSRRSVAFLSDVALEYMLSGKRRPFRAADDVTDPIAEQDYELRFLASSDAFYTFKGFLGERRPFPGRDGPPGADYNALPRMKPLDLQLVYGYWREGNRGDLERLRRTMGGGPENPAFAEAQRGVFWANLRCVRHLRQACAFQ